MGNNPKCISKKSPTKNVKNWYEEIEKEFDCRDVRLVPIMKINYK